MSRQESLFIDWVRFSGAAAKDGVTNAGGATSGLGAPASAPARLHARHLFTEASSSGAPVLLLHGAIENSGIFYSESGKGLGPFLARQGLDVYAADLLGRGRSEPRISRRSRHGQLESIRDEIPAFVELIRERRGSGTRQLWMAHSWGGVLLLSVLARRPEYRELVSGLVFFGTKRVVHVRNRESLLKIDFFWNRGARALVALHGYLPALAYGLGADNETDLSHAESRRWVMPGPWIDPRDGFDYAAALQAAQLPPMLFLAGQGDRCLGHPSDVRRLMAELGAGRGAGPGAGRGEFRLLSRAGGYRRDYGHVDMMTSADAEADHFAEVVEWVRGLG